MSAGEEAFIRGVQLSVGSAEPPRDMEEAVLWLSKPIGRGDISKRDLAGAVREFTAAAEAGCVKAQTAVAMRLLSGSGTDPDTQKGIFYLHKAAAAGDGEAEFMLSELAAAGMLPTPEATQTMWLERSAAHGYVQSMKILAEMCRHGVGMEPDKEQAYKWARKAAELGDMDAANNVAVCLQTGEGVDKDEKEALEWYRKSADGGCADAQYAMGALYAAGDLGLDQDYGQAVCWYAKAAKRSEPRALFALALCYANGYGVAKSAEKAAEWLKKAAEQGNEDAIRYVAAMAAADKEQQ